MFTYEVHFFIHGLYAYHVCLRIICKLDFMTATDALCSPIEISHIYRTAHLSCNSVKAGLPTLYRLSGPLWGKSEMDYRRSFHLIYYAECHLAASFAVDGYASQFPEKPAKWTPEKFSLYHAVRLPAD